MGAGARVVTVEQSRLDAPRPAEHDSGGDGAGQQHDDDGRFEQREEKEEEQAEHDHEDEPDRQAFTVEQVADAEAAAAVTTTEVLQPVASAALGWLIPGALPQPGPVGVARLVAVTTS